MFEKNLVVKTLAGPENKLAANLASLIVSSRLIEFGVSGFCFSSCFGCKKLAFAERRKSGKGKSYFGFLLGCKKLAAGGSFMFGVGACSSFGAASPVCACMCLLKGRRISEGIDRLAFNWHKFGDIFSYSGVKMPILWWFALLRTQEGRGEGSQVRASKHTPTPLGRPRDTHIVPPLPHAIFYPKAKLIAVLNTFIHNGPRKFFGFFHISNLNRTLKELS